MSFVVSWVVMLFFVSGVWIPNVVGNDNKIRIIIPHKINYIHHHHRRPDFVDWNYQKISKPEYEEEESEEETEGGRDEESDAAQEGPAYYAIPASEYSNNAIRVVMKPVFLGNKFSQRRRLPALPEYLRYEDYLQRLRLPEERYLFGGFDFK